jgi:tetratricopeptide (TPR) repeat protein
VIVLAGCFAFGPALHGAWLWDDAAEIARNPNLRGWAGLGRIWRGELSLDYLPVKGTVEWLGWQLWGARVFGYHALSLALHLAGALLLWRLLRRLGVRHAWLGGLLFTVHPLAVESVAWIAELKNTLSLPFLLLAFLAYLDYDAERGAGTGGRRAYARCLAAFVLSLLCKSSGMMFPAILLLHAWWRRGRVTRADARASAPFFALSLVRGLVTLAYQQHWVAAGAAVAQGGLLSRVAAAGLALEFYLAKTIWPAGLLPMYPRWAVDPPTPWQLLPWVFFALVGAGLWAGRNRGSRPVIFGLGCFVLNLLPVLGFVPLAYPQTSWVADHLAYLALAAAAGLAAAGLDAWFAAAGPGRRLVPAGAVLLAAAAGAITSHRYAAQFADEDTLWSYTVRHEPGSAEARKNLGNALARSGRVTDAIAAYTEAERLDPGDGVLAYDFGNALLQAGRVPEAIARYRTALWLKPAFPEAHDNLGIALQSRGQLAEAIIQFELALQERPQSPGIRYNLGNALLRGGRAAEAIPQYQAVLRQAPGNAQAHYNLGLAYLQSGRYPEAIAEYARTLQLMPGSAEAHNNLGNALLQSGKVTEAIIQYEEALRLDPNLAGARRDLQLALRQSAPRR